MPVQIALNVSAPFSRIDRTDLRRMSDLLRQIMEEATGSAALTVRTSSA
jgi:hypothetical protein